ncbi:hypothetical protein KBX06_17715 [Micromonospora sp. C31]|uniref:hypothetical protein n=1 Tax=Micromonospora sp. C31 TaxID=2824876 RepID=UPI001B3684D1|nr:hypothetical protein [Micromonospora sp. C31]MBQ1074989.1 hypothetical protein [Micromonospora sp. C31]
MELLSRTLLMVRLSARGFSTIRLFTRVKLRSVMSRLPGNSVRSASRTSPPPLIVPPPAAMSTPWQFSIRIALLPVSAMSTRSMAVPPFSASTVVAVAASDPYSSMSRPW